MRSGFDVTLDTSGLDRLEGRMRQAAGMAVRKAALDIEGHAKASAPVDTGNLRASVAARQVVPFLWEVAVGAEYGLYVEMGTLRTPAKPFLIPAAEAVAPAFEQAIEAIFQGPA